MVNAKQPIVNSEGSVLGQIQDFPFSIFHFSFFHRRTTIIRPRSLPFPVSDSGRQKPVVIAPVLVKPEFQMANDQMRYGKSSLPKFRASASVASPAGPFDHRQWNDHSRKDAAGRGG